MRIVRALIVMGSFVLFTCSNIADSDPSPRNTFIKFFEGPYSITASAVEEIPTGFVILGNMSFSLSDTSFTQAVLIETDKAGNRVGDIHTYNGGTGKAFKALINNGVVNGYIIVGDSIYTDPQAEQAANVIVSSMRVLSVNSAFENPRNNYISDKRPISPAHPVIADFFGGAINFTGSGEVIVLGTYKEGVVNQQNSPEKQLLFGLTISSSNRLDSAWFKTYDLLGSTYVNSKTIHSSNGKIIWASAIAEIQGDFTTSYLAIPVVQEKSVFENFSTIGQTSRQLFLPSDICPASNAAFGYGVVGTYSEQTDGSKANLFFLKVDVSGNIIPGSDRYFDGIQSFKADSLDIFKNNSSIIDNGDAITSTSDGGFVLAGTLTTIPEKGKGARDIFLVKVNAAGDVVWMKTMGGAGDEVPVTIKETSNGNLILCGTNKLGDFASVFLMKMDKNGELKN